MYFEEFCNYLISKKVQLPSNIQIVTCSNNEEQSILIQQLKRNHISFLNVVPQGCVWDNRNKIKYILEALRYVTSEYVLILDANDVLLEGDLSDLVEVLQASGKKLLYNATCNNYPNVDIDTVPDREERGKFRYLNAGCCVGTTQYARRFYRHALTYFGLDNQWNSEQFIIRHAFKDRLRYVDFDWQSRIFQTVAGCIVLKKSNLWKVV